MLEIANKFVEKLISLTAQDKITWLIERDDRFEISIIVLGQWRITMHNYTHALRIYNIQSEIACCYISTPIILDELMPILIQKIEEQRSRWKYRQFLLLSGRGQEPHISEFLEFAEKL